MTTSQIEKMQATIGKGRSFFIKREIEALPSILWEDERFELGIPGVLDSHGLGLLAATNKRLIFLDKKLSGISVTDFSYSNVTSIQYTTGFWVNSGSITIFSSGNRATVTKIPKNLTANFAEAIRAKISKPASNIAAYNSGIDELDKLIGMKDKGHLTDDEFSAAKRKLLNL